MDTSRLNTIVTTLVLFFVSGALLTTLGQANIPNTITIKEKAGVTTKNYPIQIGRAFVPGEIKNFPQAIVNNVKLATQADVKSRWPGGSAKHAILTFYLPTLNANSTVTVTFANQTAGNNTGFLTQNQMAGATYNFDAQMEIANGTTRTASAKTMLGAGNFQYWTRGSISTGILLADHSVSRAYDMGFDANRSVRPIFHATFWPAIKKIRVRFIGEIANTETLQDQMYALTLKLKSTAPQTVYTKAAFNHIAASRWTKEFWIGTAPTAIEINHNLAYLKLTNALPNYDTSRVVPEAALAQAYGDPASGWSVVAKDIFDNGNLAKYMPSTGGRDEIGPFPTWTVRWLYTGDQRLQQQAFGNADLAAAFPVHFREGAGAKLFDANANPALGKVLSVYARPTLFLHAGNQYINFSYTTPADKITPVGTMTDGSTPGVDGWVPDGAHQPDYYSPLYLLTGDYFYLEEMLFWAAWSAVATNPSPDVWYGRGASGSSGGINGEVRHDAWIFRNRAQAAFLCPDNSPEKEYFTKLTNDAIAVWEGTLNINGTSFQGTANWNWGKTVAVQKYGLHPTAAAPALGFWEEGPTTPSWSDDVDPAVASNFTLPWQHYFLVYSLGRAKELGFQTDALLSWTSRLVISQLTDPGYDPYLSGAYRVPTVRVADNQYFSLWSNSKSAYLSSYNAQADFNADLLDPQHGYAIVEIPATAAVFGETNGAQAWSFIQQNVLTATSLNDNPKWVILPRTVGAN